jgi:hypothetical protein
MEPPEVLATLEKAVAGLVSIIRPLYSSVVICAAVSPADGRIDALRPVQPLGENIGGMREGGSSQY